METMGADESYRRGAHVGLEGGGALALVTGAGGSEQRRTARTGVGEADGWGPQDSAQTLPSKAQEIGIKIPADRI
jgi:hypothetical protein